MSAVAPKRLGSCDFAAAKTTEALLNKGQSKLKALLGGKVAAYGDNCFRTYRQLAAEVGCHPESAGRAWRQLVADGFGVHKRIFPGQKPTGARWRTRQGTTDKRIRFGEDKPIGIAHPMTRGEARRARQRQGRPPAPLGPSPDERLRATAAPRHSSAAATAPLPPELASVVAAYERAMETQWDRAERDSLPDSLPGNGPGNGPPDTS